VRLVEAPGTNIAQGRNRGVAAATGEVILSTDSGCRLDARWVESIVRPFEQEPGVEFVAGFYRIAPETLLEAVVGTVTMRGALDPVDPDRFNPSCRSMAYTRNLWRRAGGFPEWTDIDDNLFNLKVRRMGAPRRFAADAVVHWRPRSSLRGIYRQFRFYATTTGHTQINAGSTRYNLRNIAICALLLIVGFVYAPLWALLAAGMGYFYVYAFHARSRRVAAKLGTWRAYPVSVAVHWAIILGDAVGYLRGSLQRWRNRAWYRQQLSAYLRCGHSSAAADPPTTGDAAPTCVASG
jgi:hypothetical protein